jgi:hypothetical protein
MELNKNKRIVIIFTAIFLGSVLAIYLLDKPNGSIINYLPYINGAVFLMVGIFAFLLTFKFYKPKYKTAEQALRIDNLLKSWGKLGKFGSIFMILFGAYNLIWHDPNIYRLSSRVENNKWTEKDREKLLKIYINGLSSKDKKHPQLIVDYCTCSVDMIMKRLTRQQYIDDFALPKDEQNNIFEPIVKDCSDTYHRRVDSADNKQK